MTTLANLRIKVSRRLEDTANSHWSTGEVDDLINETRMDLWQMVRRLNPHVLPLSTDTWTWPANSRSCDLSAAADAGHGADTDGGLGAADFDIYLVSMTPTTDAISVTNLPQPLNRIPYEEINRSSVGSSPFYEDHKHYGSLTVGESWDYTGALSDEIASTWGPGGSAAVYAWALQGHELFMSPVPRTDIQLHIEYIRPFPVAGGSDEIFDTDNAMFRPWEALVELGAVLAAKGRSDEQTDPVVAQWQYKMDLFMQWLEKREVTGTPTVVLNGY